MWWCPDGHPSMLPLAYNQLRQAALNLSTSSMTNTGSPPPYLQSTYCQHPADFYRSAVARFHHHPHDEPKPQHSYIGLIAMAILSTPEQKMILSDVYQWILDNYAYFRARGPGWRNSIRHNLSLNDCFIKSGRSANGKGHYWAIHPANLEDFTRGDFRRRRAQRKVRRHMGLAVADDDDDSGDESPCLTPAAGMIPFPMANTANTSDGNSLVLLPKKRFDVESLLAPDHQPSTIAAAAALYAASNKFGWTIWPSPPSFELSPSSMPTIAPREVTPPIAIVDDNAASSRSESPNTAAQWQTSFARIMARSYHHNQQQHQSTRKHDRSQ